MLIIYWLMVICFLKQALRKQDSHSSSLENLFGVAHRKDLLMWIFFIESKRKKAVTTDVLGHSDEPRMSD